MGLRRTIGFILATAAFLVFFSVDSLGYVNFSARSDSIPGT